MSMDKQSFKRPFPRVVRIEPAAACNLACSHCPTGTIEMTRGVMSRDTFEAALKQIEANKEFVKVVVLYHGGEPLLSKFFIEMIEGVKRINPDIFVKTISNGMLLKQEAIEGMVRAKLDLIEFSFDGNSPEENNAIRRNSDFETVKKNIDALIRYKDSVQAEYPLVDIAASRFVDPETYTKDQEPENAPYLLEHFEDYLKNKKLVGIKTAFTLRWPHMKVEDQYELYHDPFDTESGNECDHVLNTVSIRYNGDVVPCCLDLTSELVMGNILTDDLAKIWNNDAYLDLRKSIHDQQFNDLCGNCNVVKPNIFLLPKHKTAPVST